MAKRDNSPKKKQTAQKLTSNQREWQHQVANLKRRIKDLEDLGAKVAFEIPEMPKRVGKKAIEQIKKIKRKTLEKYAYQEGQYGEAVEFEPPKRGEAEKRRREVKAKRELEREEAMFNDEYQAEEEPIDIVDVELENLRSYIESFDDNSDKDLQEYAKSSLLNILDKAIEEFGRTQVARSAEQYSDANALAQAALWASKQDKVDMNVRGFSRALLGRALTYQEAIGMENLYETSGRYA